MATFRERWTEVVTALRTGSAGIADFTDPAVDIRKEIATFDSSGRPEIPTRARPFIYVYAFPTAAEASGAAGITTRDMEINVVCAPKCDGDGPDNQCDALSMGEMVEHVMAAYGHGFQKMKEPIVTIPSSKSDMVFAVVGFTAKYIISTAP